MTEIQSSTQPAAKPSPTEIAVTVVTDMMHAEKFCNFDKDEYETLCATYVTDKECFEAAKTIFEGSRDKLQLFVDKYGFVPSGADKTTRCETAKYQADVVRAVGTDINDSRVVEFQSVCRRARVASLFPLIFDRHVYYTLAAGADKRIETAKPAKKFAEAFATVYALCFSPKPKSPSVKVIDLTLPAPEKPARKPRAKKEAA